MNGAQRYRRPLHAVSVLVIAATMAMLLGTRGAPDRVFAQEATPEAESNTPRTREQVIAQGLAIFDIEPAIWRVVEIEPALFNDAEEVIGNVSFTLQIEGVTIIRNNVTLKRARLEPGEAYFFSADDPYVRYSLSGTESRAWVIEYVAPDASDDDAGGTVLFKSDPIDRFQPGTRDLELIRNVLLPGESSPLPSHRDAALVLGTSGAITLSAGSANMTLGEGNGILIPGDAFLSNNGEAPASYVVVTTGARVPDPGEEETTEEPVSEETPTDDGTPEAEATEEPDATEAPEPTATPEPNDEDGDGLNDTREGELGTDPANPDSDGDGTSDGDEVFLYGTDPLDPASVP